MFCGATKTLAMGIPLINALYEHKNNEITGLLSIPLIIYHVLQLIIGAFQVILLKKWVRNEPTQIKSNIDEIQSININS